MMNWASKFFLLLSITALLAGCKLEVTVPAVGEVTTESGNYKCNANSSCVIDVYTANFDETFVAKPAAGYQFSHWRRVSRGFCGGGKRSCRLYTTGFEVYPSLVSLLNSDQVYYLEPVFSPKNFEGNSSIVGSIDQGALLLVDQYGYIIDVEIVFNNSPDTDVNQDGINESYSFAFSNLLPNKKFSLYLVDGGEIYSVYGGTETPITNVFSLRSPTTIDLGHINWIRVGNGQFLSQFDILAQPEVATETENPIIPIKLEQPPIIGYSDQQLVQMGMGALRNGWIGGANTYFTHVVGNTRPGSSNNADTARFFLAFTTLASLITQSPSDGSTQSLNRISDILDILGVPDDLTRGSPRWIQLSANQNQNQNQNSLASEEFSSFIEQQISSDLAEAAKLLDKVSQNFRITWPNSSTGNTVENDYADALFFLGLINLERAYSSVLNAYNLKGDVLEVMERNSDDDLANDITIERFLDQNPNFLKLSDKSKLAVAKNHLLSGSISKFELALNQIQSETDAQDDDLIRLTSSDQEEINQTKEYLARTRRSISSGQTLLYSSESGDPMEDIIINLRRFFDAGVDFRGDNLLPAVRGNSLDDSQPCLTDPTFNGVVISPDLDSSIYDDYVCN